jgi:thiol-disulfide isomerase/thioredoxin
MPSPPASVEGPSPSAAVPGASPAASVTPTAAVSPGGSGVPAGSALPTPSLSSLFRVGQPAPPLKVRQLGGGLIDLAALRGYPVWIEFMQTWCPSCQEEFPLMNGFAARYAGDGLKVVAVDVKESEGDVAAFADRLSAAFPIGLDADGSAARRWGVVGVPVHFFVDASGVIRDATLGGVGADVLAASVGKIMPGVPVTP